MPGPFDAVLTMLGNVAAGINPTLGTAVKAGTAAFQNRDQLGAAAKSVSAAFENIKQLNGGAAPADAEAKHDAMVRDVTAHAQRTFDRAEGG